MNLRQVKKPFAPHEKKSRRHHRPRRGPSPGRLHSTRMGSVQAADSSGPPSSNRWTCCEASASCHSYATTQQRVEQGRRFCSVRDIFFWLRDGSETVEWAIALPDRTAGRLERACTTCRHPPEPSGATLHDVQTPT